MAIVLSEFGGQFVLVDDTSPQLGGNLDTNGFSVFNSAGATNVDISGLKYPIADGDAGDMIITDGSGTLALGKASLLHLSETNDTVVPNGYLRWDATGDNVIYTTEIDSTSIVGLAPIAYSGDWTDSTNKLLGNLEDAFITTPSTGHILVYNSEVGGWINTATKIGANINSYYVDQANGSDITGTGLSYSPFKTIGRVFTEIGIGNATDVSTVNIIVNDGTYVEDITFPVDWSFTMLSSGQVVIDGSVLVPYSETTGTEVINITWSQFYNSSTTMIRPHDDISGWSITGDYIFQNGNLDPNQNGNRETFLSGVKLEGGMSVTGASTFTNQNLHILLSTINGVVNLPGMHLDQVENSQFNSDVIAFSYVLMVKSRFSGNLTLNGGRLNEYAYQPAAWFDISVTGDINIGGSDPVIEVNGYTWNNFNYWYNDSGYTINGMSPLSAFEAGIIDVVDSHLLAQQSDVDLSVPPETGQVLKFDGQKWYADFETSSSQFVDGFFWSTPINGDQELSNNGKTVGALNDGWTVTSADRDIANNAGEADLLYFEFEINSENLNQVEVGIYDRSTVVEFTQQPSTRIGYASISYTDNSVYVDTVLVKTFTSFTLESSDVPSYVMIAVNTITKEAWVGYNGAWDDGVDPAGLITPTFTYPYNDLGIFGTPYTAGGTINSPSENNNDAPVGFTTLASVPEVRGRIGDLDDVTITNPNDSQYLGYSDGTWINREISYTELTDKIGMNDLTDATVSSPTTTDILEWNGTRWVNTAPKKVLTDLNDVTLAAPVNEDFLTFDSSTNQWRNTFVDIKDTLTSLDDTDIRFSKTLDEAVIWDGSVWVNGFVNYDSLRNLPYIPVNNDFTFIGLSDTDDPVVANGYLRWNAGGTSIGYSATIPVADVTGLAPVATAGTMSSLTDVDLTTTAPTDGQIITYDFANSKWIPTDPVDEEGQVISVFGRDGNVVALASDYDDSQIDNTSTVAGAFVSDALSALDAGKINLVTGTVGNFTAILADGNIEDSGSNTASFATAAQGALADTAIQPGDNNSELTNDSGWITLADVQTLAVESVDGRIGIVTLTDLYAPLTHATNHEIGGSDLIDHDLLTGANGHKSHETIDSEITAIQENAVFEGDVLIGGTY